MRPTEAAPSDDAEASGPPLPDMPFCSNFDKIFSKA
jgi:hypothetical protein